MVPQPFVAERVEREPILLAFASAAVVAQVEEGNGTEPFVVVVAWQMEAAKVQ